MLLRYNLEAKASRSTASARGDEARHRAAGERARPGRARLDAARPVRASNCAGSLRARPETRAAADHHADRARRGERAGARARHRRRRLHRQAVLGAGTAGARARAAAPRQSGAGRERARRSATSSSTARRSASRAPAAPIDLGPTEYRLLRVSDGAPGPRVLARAIARRRLGLATSTSTSARWTCMSGGCARRSTAASRRPDPHRARRRLCARRPVRPGELSGCLFIPPLKGEGPAPTSPRIARPMTGSASRGWEQCSSAPPPPAAAALLRKGGEG